MATISQSLKLYDGMSPVLHNIVGAMNTMVGSMQRVQQASGNMMEVKSLNAAKEQLNNAIRQYDKMGQNIRGCTEQQNKYTSSVKRSTEASGKLLYKIESIAGAYLGFQGVKSIIGTADNYSSILSRVNQINDGSRSTAEYMDQIYSAAQRSRMPFMDMAESVADMKNATGDLFKNNDELLKFDESLQKMFSTHHVSKDYAKMATVQLEQGMSIGTLRGQDYRSVVTDAPVVEQALMKYLHTSSTGKVKQMADQGKLSAQVVKSAILSYYDEISTRLNKTPKTFADVWVQFKNYAFKAMEPVLQKMNQFANSPQLQEFMAHVAQLLPKIANTFLQVFQMIAQVGNFAAQNWRILAPIILGVASAMTILKAVTLLHNAAEAIHNGLAAISAARAAIKAGATLSEAAATTTATGAQVGMNATLLACPLTWIVIGIIAVVTAIYLVTAAINKAQGTSVSATGIIFGVFATAGAHIFNTFVVPLQNGFAMLGNFLMNVFKNPAAAVKVLFADLALTVLGYIRNIAQGFQDLLRHIPAFRNLDLTSGLNSAYNAVQGFKGQTEKESGYTEYFKKWGYMSYSGAAASGYKAGQGVDAKVASALGIGSNLQKVKDEMCGKSGPALSGISGDTKKISNAATKTKEDLKYLRDIAERDAINKLTTANIAINMGGITNHNAADIDVDGAIDRMNKSLWNAAVSAAEGVHNA